MFSVRSCKMISRGKKLCKIRRWLGTYRQFGYNVVAFEGCCSTLLFPCNSILIPARIYFTRFVIIYVFLKLYFVTMIMCTIQACNIFSSFIVAEEYCTTRIKIWISTRKYHVLVVFFKIFVLKKLK